MSLIIELAIFVPLNRTFDYISTYDVKVGMRVQTTFRNRKVVGIVIAIKTKSNIKKLKTIEKVLDDNPILDKNILNLLFWVANYYHHPIGEVISTAIVKNLRAGKEAIIKNDKYEPKKIIEPKFKITDEQKKCIEQILKSIDNYKAFLLYGVTGSGKTEVYLRISKTIIEAGKQVLILVPEIGLTTQIINRFSSRLKTRVVTIHSKLSQSKKLDGYLLAKNLSAGVVLGTRSAIFTPMPNLGLIIIDEEHDSSFKQQSGLRYCARDIGFIRAKQSNIPLILGSATPSLETIKNTIDNKISYLELNNRAGGAVMPKINLIDMRNNASSILSTTLVEKIKYYLAKEKQIMLFINRRGYSPIYYCIECNWKARCDHCSAEMIYHLDINRLKCHHCAKQKMPQKLCPDCKKDTLKMLGFGTQKLEESIKSYFDNIPIIRIDRDTTKRKQEFDKHLKNINYGKPCIILGTQMLAKGHHFSNLAMVSVINADSALLSTNFRATEYLAQLLIQVSGRAGRNKEQGEVVIQTNYPQHPIFNYIKTNKYLKFTDELLEQRKKALMPPFSYQALICANAKDKQNPAIFLQEIANLIEKIDIENIEILGPTENIIVKKSDYYYFNLCLLSTDRKVLHKVLATITHNMSKIKLKNKVRWYLDIDPIEQ